MFLCLYRDYTVEWIYIEVYMWETCNNFGLQKKLKYCNVQYGILASIYKTTEKSLPETFRGEGKEKR